MIKIKGFILFLILLTFQYSVSQKNFNLVIVVDEIVVVGGISGLKLAGIDQNGKKYLFVSDYFPGNLSVSEADFSKLLDTSIRTVHLIFNYEETQGKTPRNYSYEIDLKKGWLTHYFYVLRIYNTTKKKYKRLFKADTGKGYVYEFDYPGGSTKLIRYLKGPKK